MKAIICFAEIDHFFCNNWKHQVSWKWKGIGRRQQRRQKSNNKEIKAVTTTTTKSFHVHQSIVEGQLGFLCCRSDHHLSRNWKRGKERESNINNKDALGTVEGSSIEMPRILIASRVGRMNPAGILSQTLPSDPIHLETWWKHPGCLESEQQSQTTRREF